MLNKLKILGFAVLIVCLTNCEKKDYEIEYQQGYPFKFAGNFIAFEFQGGIDFAPDLLEDFYQYNSINQSFTKTYDLVIARDPKYSDSVIIHNIYDSKLRIRSGYFDSTLYIYKGLQLEQVTNEYNVTTITFNGTMYPGTKNVPDALIIQAGLYDEYSAPFDTLTIVAYRKTGFENMGHQSLLKSIP